MSRLGQTRGNSSVWATLELRSEMQGMKCWGEFIFTRLGSFYAGLNRFSLFVGSRRFVNIQKTKTNCHSSVCYGSSHVVCYGFTVMSFDRSSHVVCYGFTVMSFDRSSHVVCYGFTVMSFDRSLHVVCYGFTVMSFDRSLHVVCGHC